VLVVAVTAFAAANIAGADMFATGIEAFRLGIAGFLVPFAFVFHPELLLKGDWVQVVVMASFAAVSATALAAVVVGHAWGPIGWGLRAACLVSAGLLVTRGLAWQLGGLVLYAAVLGWGARSRRAAESPITA
jgi:TRAP-type uncharacterized transport system fused permease subunit